MSEDNATRGAQPPPVDLDRLFDELDTSTAATFSPSSTDSRSAPDTDPDGLADHSSSPMQPGFDFGQPDAPAAMTTAAHLDNSDLISLNGAETMSRKVLMAAGALVALSLLLAVVGVLTAVSASSRIAALQESVAALETRIATLQVSGDPRVGQLQAEQTGLLSRLDEMSLKLDAMASADDGGELAQLQKRLDALERKATQTAKKPTVTASAPAKASTTKPAPSQGDWTIILLSFPTQAQANSEKSRLQKLGIRTEVSKSLVDGKPWYRLRVPGYSSQESAKAAIASVENKSGIKGAWVARR